MPTGLPVMVPGVVAAAEGLVFIQHPQHVLAAGHHVGGGYVAHRSHVAKDLTHPPPTEGFLFPGTEMMRITDHAALAAAQGQVGHGALPGHPHGQGAHGIGRLLGMKADAALAGSAAVVVLDPVALEDLHRTVVHLDGNADMVLPLGLAQELPGALVQVHHVGDTVEFRLGGRKSVEVFLLAHSGSSCLERTWGVAYTPIWHRTGQFHLLG